MRIKNFLFYVLSIFTYIFPKSKKMVVFGSWFGKKYADNSKFVYEYIKNNNKYNLKLYWMVKDKKLYHDLKNRKINVLYYKSIKGIFIQLIAKVFVCTIGTVDFNNYLWGNSILINCWHGIGTKKAGFASLDLSSVDYKKCKTRNDIISKFVRRIAISTSDFISKCYSQMFLGYNEFVKSGFPRNDMFFNEIYRKGLNVFVNDFKEKYNKIILYMPTHRKDGKETMLMNIILNLDAIDEICKKNNTLFIIKKHYYHKNEIEDLSKYKNIIDVTNVELDSQMLLYQSDILITDYSSCAFDFLLLNRPIIYYCYDIIDYITNDRDLFMPFEKSVAGIIAETKDKLEASIQDALNNSMFMKEKREDIMEIFYDSDCINNSCERVANLIYKELKCNKLDR